MLADWRLNRTGGKQIWQICGRNVRPTVVCYACRVSGTHALRMHKSAWLMVLLSAGLQILVFPLPNLYFLCWAAIAPLLVALLRAREPDTLPGG